MSESIIGARIKQLRNRKHYSQQQVAAKIGVTQGAVSQWEKGVTSPASDQLLALANIFGVSVYEIKGIDALPLNAQYNNIIPIRHNAVPVVGTIACGVPITAEQNIEGYADLPDGIRANFALRCKGESMVPTFHDGDIVLLRQQPDVQDGQIAAVLINGEATLKHVYHEPGGLLLVADNPSFAPIHIKPTADDYSAIQGLAVGFTRMFK